MREGWIFPTARGKLHRGSPLRKVLDAACSAIELGRRITPHGLRHTTNDLLRRVADGEVVRSIIGHVTEAMTHHYSHVDEGEKREAMSRVLALVVGGGSSAAATAAGDAPKAENPASAGSSIRGATQI